MTIETKTTKDRIFEAAVELFSTKGYQGSSMRDLAGKVEIKESSLYYHYPSKSAILEAILDYYIEGFKASVPDEENIKEILKDFNDPVEFWLFGMVEYFKRQPPLMEATANILLNEMLLDAQCRGFVLETMFTVQKKATELLLQGLLNRGMIRECNISLLAEQYVYMIHGLDIETRLLKKEGVSPEVTQQKIAQHITFFIEGLK